MLNNLIILRHTMDAYKDRLRAVELVTYAELCAPEDTAGKDEAVRPMGPIPGLRRRKILCCRQPYRKIYDRNV